MFIDVGVEPADADATTVEVIQMPEPVVEPTPVLMAQQVPQQPYTPYNTPLATLTSSYNTPLPSPEHTYIVP